MRLFQIKNNITTFTIKFNREFLPIVEREREREREREYLFY